MNLKITLFSYPIGGMYLNTAPHKRALAAPSNLKDSAAVLTLCLLFKDHSMQVAVRTMGNSRGVLIPKAILIQTGLHDLADLQVNQGVIEIRPIVRPVVANPRAGWAEDCQRLAQSDDDALVWHEFGNADDQALQW
jgi:antitoxin MazE